MKDSSQENYDVYETIGTYLIIGINGLFFATVFKGLFPYINF